MSTKTTSSEAVTLLRDKLTLETAMISWRELESFYARGVVVLVQPSLDLVEVGYQLAQDNKQQVDQWMATQQVGPVASAEAHEWHHQQAQLWALVIAPWVLVQKPMQDQHETCL